MIVQGFYSRTALYTASRFKGVCVWGGGGVKFSGDQ